MTTPTREQIEAEFASFIEYPSEDKRYVTTASCLLFAEHIARIAHTAGRDQGLREAKEGAKREFCEWKKLPTNALDVMKELGNFGPTVNAAHREVKGYMLDDEGDGVSCYWSSDDLRNIANGCNDVAAWLDQRAAIEQLRA